MKVEKKENFKSPQNARSIGRRGKDQKKERYRHNLEEMRIQEQKQSAQHKLTQLRQTGLVNAYEQFLRNICQNGLPESTNVYELAAQFVLKYEKKMKQKLLKKSLIQDYNSDIVRESSPNKVKSIKDSPNKSRRIIIQNTSKEKNIDNPDKNKTIKGKKQRNKLK